MYSALVTCSGYSLSRELSTFLLALTGASEPRNMGYMVRLGLWGPGTGFENFEEFIQMVDKRCDFNSSLFE